MGCCNKRCGLISGAVIGAVVGILGAILIPIGNNVIKGTVNKEVVLEPGTTAFDNFNSTGAQVYRQFWLFDVKNPVEVIEYGAKPVVIERGPYTYRTRYLPKVNITSNNNYTVSFLLPAGAIFQPAMSVGPEEDNITSLNLAVAGAFSLFPKPLHAILNSLIKKNNASLFQHRSVKELLWGYEDPLLSNKLGLFVPYNDSYDGYYTLFTGKDDVSKVSYIDRWQGEREVSYWNNTYCNMINGSDASSFPPFVDKNKPLYFFTSDICRSVSVIYTETKDLLGIKVYRFVLPASTLASPTENPDNICYCSDPVITKNCSRAGILGVGACRGGVPVYISLPHFLDGSPDLTEDVIGLSPNREHHFTYLDVEPTTGFTMRFAKRLQINMVYGPSNVIDVLKKVKDYTAFPLVWLNETAALDEETADMFKKELIGRIDLLATVQQVLMGLGASIFVICLVSYCLVGRINRNKTM